MTQVFADTHFFVALINPRDQSHRQALAVSQTLQAVVLVTTEEVLTEVLAFFAERGRYLRQLAVLAVDTILANPMIVVFDQSHRSFLAGFAFYKARLDKGSSLTDSISMEVMRQAGIGEILTHDNHFAQEGFRVLL